MTLVGIAPGESPVRERLLRHRLDADQARFAATAAQSLPVADHDTGRTAVAIVADGEPVGMFVLDRGGYLPQVVASHADLPTALLLRAFYIAPEWQGRGYGTAAVRAVGEFVRERFPHVKRVLLTVNHANPAAARAYLAGGFTDTGADYLDGDEGPQHVFELTC